MQPTKVTLYDTTLRDGTQGEGVSLSCDDKLRIARRLDEFGMAYIEGGWPGSNPKDIEFFDRAQTELSLKHARLTAFGSTCKAGVDPAEDEQVQLLIRANTPAVTIFGKTWDLHVTEVLRTTLDENLRMIRETVRYLKRHGKEVVYDAEHFFDGYRANPEYALSTLKAAIIGGADSIVLCDTNGGSLPWQVGEAVDTVLPGGAGPGIARRPSSLATRPHHRRHSRPQRQRDRRRQHAGGGASRLHAGAGHGQRLRRALRQRQHGQRHPRPATEDGLRLRAGGESARARRTQPLRQRDGQPQPRHAPALRRAERVCPQGRHARQRRGQVRDELPAHRPGARRQRDARAGQRTERQGQHCQQAPRVWPGRAEQGRGARASSSRSRSWRTPALPSRAPRPAST